MNEISNPPDRAKPRFANVTPGEPWPDDMVMSPAPIFGDSRSAERHHRVTADARELQRLARIRSAVAPGCSVRVGTRTFTSGDRIGPGDCRQVGAFWSALVSRRVVILIDSSEMPPTCSHGATHAFKRAVVGRMEGEGVCAQCFHVDARDAVPEVAATLRWDGSVVLGSPPQPAVRALDGKKALADLVARGFLRPLEAAEKRKGTV